MEEAKQEKKNEFEGMPRQVIKSWLGRIDDETYEVTTKSGIFILEDVEYDVTTRAKKRGKAAGTEDKTILSTYITHKDGVKTTVGELEIGKFKTKAILRLMFALNLISGSGEYDDFRKVSDKN